MTTVEQRWQRVRREVADAADAAGRDASAVTIVGVTKTVGVDVVAEALRAGIDEFGENRVQEFLGKYGLFPTAHWHFIGTLQTNKVKDVVGRAALIHSVDSLRLLREIGRRSVGVGVVQPVLLQVNVSGEDSKHGFAPDELEQVVTEAAGIEGVAVRGLMTMAPFGHPEQARPVFCRLRELSESLRGLRCDGVELEQLSMGMSNDYRVAVEEGATIIRVGRALFGR